MTFDFLRKTMLKDIPEGNTSYTAMKGIIDCYEKMGKTADEAFEHIVKVLDKK